MSPMLRVGVLLLFLSWAHIALSDGAAPVVFEPLPAGRLPVVGAQEFERVFGQSLSMTPDGSYVALARLPGVVDIWSAGVGAKTATLRIAPKEDGRVAHAALFGPGCVAVTGIGVTVDVAKAWTPPQTTPSVGLWDCRTGKRIADVPTGGRDRESVLLDLKAVPACGFAVAQYGDRIAVIDVARQALVPNLGQLFEVARSSAVQSYPADKRTAWSGIVRMAIADPPREDSCVVHAVVYEFDARAKTFVPAKLYAFDLSNYRVTLVRSLSTDLPADLAWEELMPSLAVSPSQRYAVLALGAPFLGRSHLLFIELEERAKQLRLQQLSDGISEPVFLSDEIVFLVMTSKTYNVDAQLVDRASGRLHTLCSTVFGEPDVEKGNPRTVAVSSGSNRIAVSMRDEIRLYRYLSNPKGRWSGVRDCVDD